MRAIAVPLLLLSCLTAPAGAQVSVDMRALDPPGPARPSVSPPPAAKTFPPADPRPTAKRRTARHTPPVPAPSRATAATRPANAPAAAGPPAATPPAAVPAPAQPLVALPVAPPPAALPPPSAAVPAEALTPASLPPPVRLTFERGQTDLSIEDEAAIRDLARSIAAPAANSVSVLAYAAGQPDDPSTARRLSLSRGMAVRSALIENGIPSARIYVRALGSAASGASADRVELTVTRPGVMTR